MGKMSRIVKVPSSKIYSCQATVLMLALLKRKIQLALLNLTVPLSGRRPIQQLNSNLYFFILGGIMDLVEWNKI